jgi:hypothetical protein
MNLDLLQEVEAKEKIFISAEPDVVGDVWSEDTQTTSTAQQTFSGSSRETV